MKRHTIARGIYRDTNGYSVRWPSPDPTKPHEQRFPLDTPHDVLKRFRATQIGQSRTRPATRGGSFVRDCAKALRLLRQRSAIEQLRSHLRPWVTRFPRQSRWTIDRKDVLAAVADWQADGFRPGTIKQRIIALRTVFRTLDADDPIACCHRTIPTQPTRLPRGVPPEVVARVAANLYARECRPRRPVPAVWRARLLVLASSGVRPIQLMRTQPEDVDLERRIWIVDSAKGDAGTIVQLNEDMLAAWRLFIAANAWGPFDSGSYGYALRAAGWPKGIPPYNVRHETGQALSRAGIELGDIQLHMGHRDLNTTRRSYVPGVAARLRAASQAIDGRFPAAAFRSSLRAVASGKS